jgi:hypothetical protein
MIRHLEMSQVEFAAQANDEGLARELIRVQGSG